MKSGRTRLLQMAESPLATILKNMRNAEIGQSALSKKDLTLVYQIRSLCTKLISEDKAIELKQGISPAEVAKKHAFAECPMEVYDEPTA